MIILIILIIVVIVIMLIYWMLVMEYIELDLQLLRETDLGLLQQSQLQLMQLPLLVTLVPREVPEHVLQRDILHRVSPVLVYNSTLYPFYVLTLFHHVLSV